MDPMSRLGCFAGLVLVVLALCGSRAPANLQTQIARIKPHTAVSPASAALRRIHNLGCVARGPSRVARRRTHVAAASDSDRAEVPEGSVTAIILAGGVGKRMGAAIPKQYLDLNGKPIAAYSLSTFAQMPEVGELVVVCLEDWQYIFEEEHEALPDAFKKPLVWARPGNERQDSVYNGLQAARDDALLVAIHDSARPLIDVQDARNCMRDGATVGAAVLGVPVKPTIKEVNEDGTVAKTLVRSKLWEVQTPQCIKPGLLKEGFDYVKAHNLEVTDDVSVIEAIEKPVLITKGSYTNIKVTTPDDMSVAIKFLGESADATVSATPSVA